MFTFQGSELDPKMRLGEEQHHEWATLGFIRAVAATPSMCQALTTQAWIRLLVNIIDHEHSSLQRKVSDE